MSKRAEPSESAAQAASHVVIREGRPDDIPALLELEQTAFPGDRLSRQSFHRLLAAPSAALLVAVDGPGDPHGQLSLLAPPEALVGYALVLFREGSRLARLYSIAVAPSARGRGLARRLLDAAEHAATARARTVMRLEVRADNPAAIGLYRARGYRELERVPDYYADHMEALRFERALVPDAPSDATLRHVPYFAQTTEFTCGPAVLSMALATHGLATPSAELELALWREANCVYLISAPGGCDPIGLALAAWRHGLHATVYASHPGPWFVEVTRGATARAIMSQAQEVFRHDAEQAGVPVRYERLTLAALVAALDRGALALVLVSPWLLIRSTVPHWILAYARNDKGIVVHDPYHDPDPARAPAHEAVTIPYHDFEHMTVWGKTRLSATILLEARTQP